MIKQTDLRKIYFLFPPAIILFPIFPAYFPGYLGDQIVFILALSFVLVSGTHVYKTKFSEHALIYFLYFLYSILFALICDIYRGDIVISDFFEIAKPIAFLLFFTLYRRSYLPIEQLEQITYRTLALIFCGLCIYCLIEFVFPELVRPLSFILYKRESMPILANKAIGSLSQTYNFAYILLLPLIFLFVSFLYRMQVKNAVLFLLFFFVLLLTQSRSMYICFAATMFLCFCIPLLYRDTKSTFKILVFVFLLVAIFAFIFLSLQDVIKQNFSYAYYGIEAMLDGDNNSVNTRGSQVEWAIENNHFMIIGAGIGKGVIMLESFYSLYYYRYGIIGVTLYLLLIFYTSLTSYKIAKIELARSNELLGIIYISLFVFYTVTPIALLSSTHQDTPKISLIFYGLMGLIFNKYSTLKKERFD